MMATINEIQDEIIEEFAMFDDWMDRYSLLIELGNSLGKLDDKYKVESNLIVGCQSRVWLYAEYADGKIIFLAESDAVIVKGMPAVCVRPPATLKVFCEESTVGIAFTVRAAGRSSRIRAFLEFLIPPGVVQCALSAGLLKRSVLVPSVYVYVVAAEFQAITIPVPLMEGITLI